MIWLFASVVLLLIVFHAGFRKFALWFGGIAAAIAAIGLAVGWWNASHPKQQSADAYLDAVSCTYGPKLPNGDCPAAPRFNVASSRPVAVNGRCPAGQQLGTTDVPTCYNPHDAAQLAEHLKECASDWKPGDPEWKRDPIVADKFGIPCNSFDQFDNDCPAPPATPWPGCVSRDSKPWTKYPKATAKMPVTDPAGLVKDPAVLKKLNSAPDCPAGQQAVTLNNDSPWSCYDPQDAAQVAQHLKECKPSEHFIPYTDHRGVSCAKTN